MDVHVHAGQDSMPAGMAKILEILNSSVDTVNAKGELSLSDNIVFIDNSNFGDVKTIVASFRSSDGVLDAKQIQIYEVASSGEETLVASADGEGADNKKVKLSLADSDESVVCEFTRDNVGRNYYFRAGDCKTLVSVMKK